MKRRWAIVHKLTGEVLDVRFVDAAPEDVLRGPERESCDIEEVGRNVRIGCVRVWDEPEPPPPPVRAHHFKATKAVEAAAQKRERRRPRRVHPWNFEPKETVR